MIISRTCLKSIYLAGRLNLLLAGFRLSSMFSCVQAQKKLDDDDDDDEKDPKFAGKFSRLPRQF